MAFTDFPFPPSTPLYPKASVVQSYLESYCHHFGLSTHIQLRTTVLDVWRDESRWKVKISTGDTLDFDIIVIANGHYRTPRYPDTPGLSEWRAGGRATHSAWYRNPHKFVGKTVLVVGGGPSGKDIAAEVCTVATRVIHSFSGRSPEDSRKPGDRDRVIEFKSDGQVVFEDGTTEHGIDHCILATGFEVSFPFLRPDTIREGLPPPFPPLQRDLYNSTYHVFPLARHIFPIQPDIPPGSLVFLGLLVRVAPFALVEAQARAAVKVIAQPESLDLDAEMLAICDRYRALQACFWDDPLLIAKVWDRLPNDEQFDYRDRLYEFAEDASEKRIIVPQWERDMYERKFTLRTIWRTIEEKGESEQWLDGVGVGGQLDWVDFTDRLLCSKRDMSN